MNDLIRIDPAQLPQKERRWAESGESGLDEVGGCKGWEEEPPRADQPAEGGAEENEGASEDADEGIGFHDRA